MTHSNITASFPTQTTLLMMFTPETTPADFARLERALLSVLPPRRSFQAACAAACRACTFPARALFSPSETLPLSECENRILADAT